MKPTQNAYVILPNCMRIPIEFIGTVKIATNLTLEDVLFVLQFKSICYQLVP